MKGKQEIEESVDTKAVVAAAEEPVANRFTPDAQDRISRLRAMGDEFPDEAEPQPLTLAEVRLARGTPVAALEKAALLAEAAPEIGGPVAAAADLRDAIAFELAYGGLRDEAAALQRRVDLAILRRKLKAVKAARGLYRIAKGWVTVPQGDAVRPHVTQMKHSLARPRRKALPAATVKKAP